MRTTRAVEEGMLISTQMPKEHPTAMAMLSVWESFRLLRSVQAGPVPLRSGQERKPAGHERWPH